MVGGFNNVADASQEHQDILLSVKPEIEQRLGHEVSKLEALKVTTQVVAGVNYLIKAKVDDSYVHVKIAKPLPHTGRPPFVLALHHADLNADSPLVPFE